MSINYLDDVSSEEFLNKKVLLRLDLNVPMSPEGEIVDPSKIELVLGTIRKLLRLKAKIIICSHLGSPKGKFKKNLSLEPVAIYLRDLLNKEVVFIHESVGSGVLRIVNERSSEEIIFLENLRFSPGEEKNDPVFAKMLARLADVYVNDAFASLHRPHASICAVPDLIKNNYAGLLIKQELSALKNIFSHPQKPLVLIMGAAKVSSKIGVLAHLLPKVNFLLIGGAMAYTFLRAKGENVGKSLVEEDKISLAKNLLSRAKELGVQVILPCDHIVADKNMIPESIRTIYANEFQENELGFDIGPDTILKFADVIAQAKTIFWNGPLGMFEHKPFAHGTFEVAKALAHSDAYTVVGGGDSLSALKEAGVKDQIDFISSGGGATLELLEGKKLPGLRYLGYYDA